MVVEKSRAVFQGIQHGPRDPESNNYGKRKRLTDALRKAQELDIPPSYVGNTHQVKRTLLPELLQESPLITQIGTHSFSTFCRGCAKKQNCILIILERAAGPGLGQLDPGVRYADHIQPVYDHGHGNSCEKQAEYLGQCLDSTLSQKTYKPAAQHENDPCHKYVQCE